MGKIQGSRKTMKLSVRMSILLGILTFVGISIVNFGTLRLTRLSFTDAMDQNMEDKAKASGEELAAIISKWKVSLPLLTAEFGKWGTMQLLPGRFWT